MLFFVCPMAAYDAAFFDGVSEDYAEAMNRRKSLGE